MKRSEFSARHYPWTCFPGIIVMIYMTFIEEFRADIIRKKGLTEFNSTYFESQSLHDQNPPLELLYLVAIIGSPEEADPYLHLLIPFTLHALLSDPFVGVEIILSDDLYSSFTTSRIDVLDQLRNRFGENRLLLRTATPYAVNLAVERCKGHAANFVRFLERPILNARVTFNC